MDGGGLQSTSDLQILLRLLTFPSITSTVWIASTTYLAMAVVSLTYGFEGQDDDGFGHLSASVEMLCIHPAARVRPSLAGTSTRCAQQLPSGDFLPRTKLWSGAERTVLVHKPAVGICAHQIDVGANCNVGGRP